MDFDWLYESDEDELEELAVVIHGLPRKIYERSNPFFEFDDLEFFRRFRLSKNTVLQFLPEIEEFLEFPSNM